MSLIDRLHDLKWRLAENCHDWVLRAQIRLGSSPSLDFRPRRRQLSARFLEGNGLEIGALHEPLGVSNRARVRYVDRLSVPELRNHYPELANHNLVPVDILDDGEKLMTIDDNSVDFVIANHMLEHCEDPLTALKTFLRIVRPGGIVYLAIPDKRYTFDVGREVTPIEHILRDHLEGPQHSRKAHFLDWVRKVNHKPEDQVQAECDLLMKMQYSIHFHVWTLSAFARLLRYCRNALKMPFNIELLQFNEIEVIAILRKTVIDYA